VEIVKGYTNENVQIYYILTKKNKRQSTYCAFYVGPNFRFLVETAIVLVIDDFETSKK